MCSDESIDKTWIFSVNQLALTRVESKFCMSRLKSTWRWVYFEIRDTLNEELELQVEAFNLRVIAVYILFSDGTEMVNRSKSYRRRHHSAIDSQARQTDYSVGKWQRRIREIRWMKDVNHRPS